MHWDPLDPHPYHSTRPPQKNKNKLLIYDISKNDLEHWCWTQQKSNSIDIIVLLKSEIGFRPTTFYPRAGAITTKTIGICGKKAVCWPLECMSHCVSRQEQSKKNVNCKVVENSVNYNSPKNIKICRFSEPMLTQTITDQYCEPAILFWSWVTSHASDNVHSLNRVCICHSLTHPSPALNACDGCTAGRYTL